MDIIFNCPKCEQELEVDSSGAGSEIECPNCSETITIPEVGTAGTRTSGASESRHGLPTIGGPPWASRRANTPTPSPAAAKIERPLKAPVRKTSKSLIPKPLPPLDATAKETDKKMRVKTIRH